MHELTLIWTRNIPLIYVPVPTPPTPKYKIAVPTMACPMPAPRCNANQMRHATGKPRRSS